MIEELTFSKTIDGEYQPNNHPYLGYNKIKTTRDSSCLGSGIQWIEPVVNIRDMPDGHEFETKMSQHGWSFEPVFRMPNIWGFVWWGVKV